MNQTLNGSGEVSAAQLPLWTSLPDSLPRSYPTFQGSNGAFAAWLAREEAPRLIVDEVLRTVWASPTLEALKDAGLDFLNPRGAVWTRQLRQAVLGATDDHPEVARVTDQAGDTRGVFISEIAAEPARLFGIVIGRPCTASRFSAFMSQYGLTRSETRVIGLLLGGAEAGRIAQELNIGKETLKTHVKHAYSKIGVGSRGELFALALRFEAP